MKFFKMVYFTKEGKGIDEKEPQKRAFFRFWSRFWEKRYSIIGANFLYLLGGIISLAIASFVFFISISLFVNLDGTDNILGVLLESQETSYFATEGLLIIMALFAVFFTCIPVFAVGPLYAGLAFLLRSFVTEEPVFLWHDFKTKTKTNFKLSTKVGITNAIAGFLLVIDGAAYFAISNNSSGFFSDVPNFMLVIAITIIIFLTVLLLMVNLYVYPIMVTFNITFKQLYKNALIFSLIRWIPNLLMLILNAVIVALPFFIIILNSALYVPALLYIVITPAFIGFLNNFYVNSAIRKYLLDNEEADKSEDMQESENVAY